MSKYETHIQTRCVHGRVTIVELTPMFKYPDGDGALYCKYCHTEHHDWRVMNPLDYGIAGIVLCAKCGQTSKDDKLETGMLVNMYELAGHVLNHVCDEKLQQMRDGLARMAISRLNGDANGTDTHDQA